MRKMFAAVALLAVLIGLFAAVAYAGDRGPQRAVTLVTSNTLATSVKVGIPIGDTGRFVPEWMAFKDFPAGQVVFRSVSGFTTSTVATVTAAGSVVFTNAPTMFYGDAFYVSATNAAALAAGTATVHVVGTVFD